MLDNIHISNSEMAGAAGAAISMAFIEGTVLYRAVLFCGGYTAAKYITPLAVKNFGLSEPDGASFIIGIFAMSLTAAIIRVLKGVEFNSLFEQLRAWFGRK